MYRAVSMPCIKTAHWCITDERRHSDLRHLALKMESIRGILIPESGTGLVAFGEESVRI